MTERCRAVRERLEAGEPAEGRDLAEHLAACAPCRAHASVLHVLAALGPAEASEETVTRIVAALPPAPWLRRRASAWLPLAAALALVAGGLVLVGGVPAPGVVSSLPAAAGALSGWLVSSLLDALAAARAGTGAAQALATAGGIGMIVWLIAAALGGSWAVAALVGRPWVRRRR